jgi:HK97 family phage portal protein
VQQVGLSTIVRFKALALASKFLGIPLQSLSGRGGWWSIVREPFMGAWQRNEEVKMNTVLTYGAVFACTTMAASDVAKCTLRLVEKDENGIWNETENPAYSPVLRKPNRYQTFGKYVEVYITSKLVHGNAYVLKVRDRRGVVTGLYVLDPTRVTPLVAPDGSIYYQLKRDDLSNLPLEETTVPASEIIHDTMVPLYHPLVGVSPLYACGVAAMQGLAIQSSSKNLFTNGSIPGGFVSSPHTIPQEAADRLKAYFQENFTGDNAGNVAILGDGLEYKPMSWNAVDAQLIDQLKWTGENVCTAYHIPAYLIGIGPPPPYANIEPLIQQYFAQCLQSLMKHFEDHHDKGLGLGSDFGNRLGTEFLIDDLFWLDIGTRMKAAHDGINGGLSFNEVRKRFHGVGPVKGGESPLSQEQYYSLEALAERDANQPFAKPAQAPAPDDDDETDDITEDQVKAFADELSTKLVDTGGWRAAA